MQHKITEYKTGATRSPRGHKYDMTGFTSPLVESIYGKYMQKNRYQSDGKIRDADNWKKGMCIADALESGDRHWKSAKALLGEHTVIDPDTGEEATVEDCLCGVMFACQVILRERALYRGDSVCFGEVQEVQEEEEEEERHTPAEAKAKYWVWVEQPRKKTVYLAGQMRGKVHYGFPAFETWARELRRAGWNIVSPAEMDLAEGIDPYALPEGHDWSKEPPGVNLEDIMERNLEALRGCDAIAMIPGWLSSEGALLEHQEANLYDLPRIYLKAGLPPATPEEIFGEEQ